MPLRRVNDWLDNGTSALAGRMPMSAAKFVYARVKPARLPRRLQRTRSGAYPWFRSRWVTAGGT